MEDNDANDRKFIVEIVNFIGHFYTHDSQSVQVNLEQFSIQFLLPLI